VVCMHKWIRLQLCLGMHLEERPSSLRLFVSPMTVCAVQSYPYSSSRVTPPVFGNHQLQSLAFAEPVMCALLSPSCAHCRQGVSAVQVEHPALAHKAGISVRRWCMHKQ
jgi:hypothetical protein